jgi:hypothetical protein
MVHADISIFASSHYVPLGLQQTNATEIINGMAKNILTSDEDLSNKQILLPAQVADPAEFLGSIYHFDEPLVFQPAGLFEPKTTTTTSQVQIKQPGSSEDDNSGNERW